jgi:hypothetical protein
MKWKEKGYEVWVWVWVLVHVRVRVSVYVHKTEETVDLATSIETVEFWLDGVSETVEFDLAVWTTPLSLT